MKPALLLVLPNWVGDAVMATPAVRALREHFDGVEIIGTGPGHIGEVFAGSPWLDQFIAMPRRGSGWFRAAWALRNQRIGTAVLFPNSIRSALVATLAGATRVVGFARYGRDLLLSERLYPRRGPDGRPRPTPILPDYLRLAVATGARIRSNKIELFTTPQDERAADAVWQRTGLETAAKVVCLNPGAAFGSAKLWPEDYFATLAQRFVDDCGAGVLILCGPAERELARRIERLAGRPQVHSLADENVSIGLTKACIQRCDLLVSTDSGPRHFAAGFDRPVVALFGPTHIEWTLTGHSREVQLQEQVACGPCQLRACPTDHRCMTELRPGRVFAVCQRLLQQEAAHAA